MNSKIKLLVIVLITCFFNSAVADDITALNPVEKLTISSERFPEGISLNITLPQGYQDSTDKKYVVLFDLHPRSQPFLSGMQDWMSHNGEWPWLNTIIVTNSGTYNTTLAKHHEAAIAAENELLLDFFEHDLIPSIDTKYRTNGFRIFSGFTSNASLGIYTLLNRPHLFNAYISASPILANDHLRILSQAKTKLEELKLPRYLFLSSGNTGYEKAHQAGFKKLTTIVNATENKQLVTNIKRFDDAYYMTQPVLATAHAIEDIFRDINEDLPADSEISKQGAQAVINHYDYLSTEKFGFKVSAQSSLQALGNSLLDSNPKKAIEVLTTATKEYPNSTFAFSALASAHFKLNKIDEAVKVQRIAVEKSKALITWHQRKQQEYLDKYLAASK